MVPELLIQTKLQPVLQNISIVNRERIHGLFRESWSSGKRLTLVSAPAGYGKTTAVISWLGQDEIPYTWLSLDADDDDPIRFLTYMVYALRKLVPDFGAQILSALNAPQRPNYQNLVTVMINEIAAWPENRCLVLDDLHMIEDPQIYQMLSAMMDYMPPVLHLVITTRQDPPLQLSRLRARRQVAEIRAMDLKFDLSETGEFIHHIQAPELTEDEQTSLWERTEGWITGLQLAGLSLQHVEHTGKFLETLIGTNRYIIDYLIDEVINGISEATRKFIYRMVLLDQFNPDLCDMVLEVETSREELVKLETANLFLIPLDTQRYWYRFHHLFAEILSSELPLSERKQVYQRAASWYANHQIPTKGIRYALAAENFDLAVQLIHSILPDTMRSGQITTLLKWVDQIPQAYLLDDIELMVYLTWFHFYQMRLNEASRFLQKLKDRGLAHIPEDLQGLVLGLSAWQSMIMNGRWDLNIIHNMLEKLDETRDEFRPVLYFLSGQALGADGDLRVAEQQFRTAYLLANQLDQPLVALPAGNNLAFQLLSEGKLQAAKQLCEEMISACADTKGKPTLMSGIPYIPFGCILFSEGELDSAYHFLTQGLSKVRQLGVYSVYASPAEQALCYLLAYRGQKEAALAIPRQLRQHAEKAGIPVLVTGSENLESAVRLYFGVDTFVEEWITKRQFDGQYKTIVQYDRSYLHYAKALIYQKRYSQALEVLDQLERLIEQLGRYGEMIPVLLQKSKVLIAMGNEENAKAHLERAVSLASPGGYRQMFLEAGKPVLNRVYRFADIAPAFVASLQLEKLASKTLPSERVLIDPLSDRELELLQFVALGNTNQQTADHLFITVGTVKWHLNHIYAKLGVKNRTKAIVVARELSLVD
jgi:LuxR family maltose regulon positive regulatory protein